MPRELTGPFADRIALKKKRDSLVERLKELTVSERAWLDEHSPALDEGDASTRSEFARRLEEKYSVNYELGDAEWRLGNTPAALINLRAAYEFGSDELRLRVIETLRDIQNRTGIQLLKASDLKPGDNVAEPAAS
ncbi:MAG TPA: hypothetical protein PKK84_07440 [Armatimonadota bacterium]|jgi:hypothetical protein|nr:hypothetical protein [Armatimonadota bacterium]